MPEILNLKNMRDPAEWFAIMSVTLSKTIKNGDIPNREGGGLEISLTINGVEIPFTESVKEMYRRMEETLNERAAKIACEKATLKGLEDLSNTIQAVDYQLRAKIEEVFGVDLKDNY